MDGYSVLAFALLGLAVVALSVGCAWNLIDMKRQEQGRVEQVKRAMEPGAAAKGHA